MLHGAPERVFKRVAFQILVPQWGFERLICQLLDEVPLLGFHLSPFGFDGIQVRKFRSTQKRWRRHTLPTFQPNPLRPHDVNQRLSNRGKTAPEFLIELFRAESCDGFQDGGIRPLVIPVKLVYILFANHSSLRKLVCRSSLIEKFHRKCSMCRSASSS